jgi:maltose alpha-D-glucosyltransferase/alpha-amylase
MTRFLSEETSFKNLPVYKGAVDFTNRHGNIMLGMMQDLCLNQGDAWTLMQAEVEHYYNKISEEKWNTTKKGQKLQFEKVPETLNQLIGVPLFDKISLLARTTAKMHKSLASNKHLKDFKPSPFDTSHRNTFYLNVEFLIDEKLLLLEQNLDQLSAELKHSASILLNKKEEIKTFFKGILSENTSSKIIRIHGDYHLGQVLYTGDDFIILDFEGEPDKSADQRRLKYSPLKDVAGMMRSFSYAAYAVLYNKYNEQPTLQQQLEPWAKEWYNYVGRIFLDVYFDEMKDTNILESKDDLLPLIQVFLFEKAIYELGYELNNRKAWVNIPMTSVMQFVNNYLND